MNGRPPIGARIMRGYGRKEYVDYGELGTVVEHGEGARFTVEIDDHQPLARWMYGAKAKTTGHAGRLGPLTPGEVELLADVYRGNAERFRRVAADWERAAEEVSA